MSNINLLPWRELQRAQNNRKMLVSSIGFWLICAVVGLLALQNLNARLDLQNKRNQFLIAENVKLNRKIADIKKLEDEKQALFGRIEVIQDLQKDRIHIVHVFDDIVRKLPAGVTLDKMSKRNKSINLSGRAQSNTRVSELMNKANSSKFFGSSNLNVVALKGDKDSDIREFEVVLTEAKEDENKAGAGGVVQQ